MCREAKNNHAIYKPSQRLKYSTAVKNRVTSDSRREIRVEFIYEKLPISKRGWQSATYPAYRKYFVLIIT